MCKEENSVSPEGGKKELSSYSFVSVHSVAAVSLLELVLQSGND